MTLFEFRTFVIEKLGEEKLIKKRGLNRAVERLCAEVFAGRIKITRTQKRILQAHMNSILENGMICLEETKK